MIRIRIRMTKIDSLKWDFVGIMSSGREASTEEEVLARLEAEKRAKLEEARRLKRLEQEV